MNVFHLPPHQPFLATLVKGLLTQHRADPETLSDIQLLLPNRRACRTATDLFLDQSDGRPLLLPRLQAVADIDDAALEILVVAATGTPLQVPRAITPTERRVALSEMVRARDPDMDYGRAVGLADALAELLDQVADEGLCFDALDHLVADEYAAHWQLTLNFLSILRSVWPEYLRARGLIDVNERRSLLLRALARYWQDHPPKFPVIMAGVSGSLPAVAELMAVVARLPQGQVVLSGFNPEMGDQGKSDPQHPYYELQHVMAKLGIGPGDVKLWPAFKDEPPLLTKTRGRFWAEVMKEAAASENWVDLKNVSAPENIDQLLPHLRLVECHGRREEAAVIAMHARLVLEDPSARLSIVTPDRDLAREIVAACARFGIDVNDSGGDPLGVSAGAGFLQAWLKVVMGGYHPVDILALIAHPLFYHEQIQAGVINRLDLCLRGIRPPGDDLGFWHEMARRGLSPQDQQALAPLRTAWQKLSDLLTSAKIAVKEILQTHLQIAESFCARDENGESLLWQGEAGEALALFFRDFMLPDLALPEINGGHYPSFLSHFMQGRNVNIRGVGHPRLALLGVFESRLIAGTHVVIAGMNEDQWPPATRIDPWLSRRMRGEFGLPDDTRRVGRMASDFLQLVHTENVMMTRAHRGSGGVTVPSRWWQRFETVLLALGRAPDTIKDQHLTVWVRGRDAANDYAQFLKQRPSPRPPLGLRPTKISATNFETLLRHPYAFYARKILRLYPRDPYDMPIEGRVRGNILHRVLERFAGEFPKTLPSDGLAILHQYLNEEMKQAIPDHAARMAIAPRLKRALTLYLDHEKTWRDLGYQVDQLEGVWIKNIQIDEVTYQITARLDRLDRHLDGHGAVIDYKTGATSPNLNDTLAGRAPQIPIEVWLVEQGEAAQAGQAVREVSAAMIWPVRARADTPKAWQDEDLQALRDIAAHDLQVVLAAYHNDTSAYYPIPDPDLASDYDDYTHLSRQDEWFGVEIFGEGRGS